MSSPVCNSRFDNSTDLSLAGRFLRRTLTASDCLGKNGYDESKCTAEIDALYECCNQFYKQNGDDAKSVCCPKASLLRLKIKQLADQKAAK